MRMQNVREKIKQSGCTLANLAREMRVEKSTVTRWMQSRVPAERVADISAITGIPKHELRPDIFDPAPQKEPAA